MTTLSTIGIPAPADFATSHYEAISLRISVKKDSHTAIWSQCAAAWNAVAFRFISCAEHCEAFTASVRLHGAAPKPLERYVQERELFGFFVTGLAAIESFCYGAHMFAAIVDPQNFSIAQPRDIQPNVTAKLFAVAFPTESLTKTLELLNNDQAFKSWKEVRNVLAHRVAPGRQHFLGGSQHGNALWLTGIAIDTATTVSRRTWLAGKLSGLLEAADTFTAKHL